MGAYATETRSVLGMSKRVSGAAPLLIRLSDFTNVYEVLY